jgi:heme-degrading monooxygenase HmoA
MIARTWRGTTKAERADEYLEYLKETGVNEYAATEGNRGVFVLRRISDGRAEFLLVSLWDSMDDVKRFAGEQAERAVFYPEDDEFLVDREIEAIHYEVLVAP